MASTRPAVFSRSALTIILWDLVGSCNLKCPSCPMGNMRGSNARGFIDDELFHAVLAKLQRDFGGADGTLTCKQLHFYNWTEPLLHPRIVTYCRTAADAGFHVHLSSNLNHLPDATGIVASGIKTLRISLSGFTQETYRIGHRGGDIERVKKNMKRLSQVHAACGLARPPRVHVYYHRYRHNNHEMDAMERFARDLGFEFQSDWAFLMPLEKLLAYDEGTLTGAELEFVDAHFAPRPNVALQATREAGGCALPCELIEQLVLDHRGRAMLCCATFDNRSNIIGNYLDLDWQALQQRRYAHAMCSRCTKAGAHSFYTNVARPALRERISTLAEESLREPATSRNPTGVSLPIWSQSRESELVSEATALKRSA